MTSATTRPQVSRPRTVHPVFLAGGRGVRLWPVSTPRHPKPFVRLAGTRTLLQVTAERFADSSRFALPVILCNRTHRFLVAEQLQQIGVRPRQIVLEPLARGTAPAACTAALFIAQQVGPDSLLLLAPSDHLIADIDGFLSAVDVASEAAARDRIVALGARPDRPETGYGYVEVGSRLDDCSGGFSIRRFVEKPDRGTAEAYLAGGLHLWNSGMFVTTAERLLAEMARWAPAVLTACRRSLASATADEDFLRLDEAAFAEQPVISLDVAVMERTEHGAVVPIDIGWSDIGCWDALYQAADKDARGNVLNGEVLAVDCDNSYLQSSAVPIAALGLEGIAVVGTADALLICPRARSQDMGAVVDRLAGDPRFATLVEHMAEEP